MRGQKHWSCERDWQESKNCSVFENQWRKQELRLQTLRTDMAALCRRIWILDCISQSSRDFEQKAWHGYIQKKICQPEEWFVSMKNMSQELDNLGGGVLFAFCYCLRQGFIKLLRLTLHQDPPASSSPVLELQALPQPPVSGRQF